jgi:hypothetical protein
MVLEHDAADPVQGSANRGDLDEDVRTGFTLAHHPVDGAEVSLCPGESSFNVGGLAMVMLCVVQMPLPRWGITYNTIRLDAPVGRRSAVPTTALGA